MRRILLIAMAVFLTLTCSAYAAKKFPSRNITNVVVWGAGGGTDVNFRIFVNAVNESGAVHADSGDD